MITFIIASSTVAFAKTVCCEGRLKYFETYLNDYTEFDSKNPYIMFLHSYLLACETSTVRTLAGRPVAVQSINVERHTGIHNHPL